MKYSWTMQKCIKYTSIAFKAWGGALWTLVYIIICSLTLNHWPLNAVGLNPAGLLNCLPYEETLKLAYRMYWVLLPEKKSILFCLGFFIINLILWIGKLWQPYKNYRTAMISMWYCFKFYVKMKKNTFS
jgi:hypothetical protein